MYSVSLIRGQSVRDTTLAHAVRPTYTVYLAHCGGVRRLDRVIITTSLLHGSLHPKNGEGHYPISFQNYQMYLP